MYAIANGCAESVVKAKQERRDDDSMVEGGHGIEQCFVTFQNKGLSHYFVIN